MSLIEAIFCAAYAAVPNSYSHDLFVSLIEADRETYIIQAMIDYSHDLFVSLIEAQYCFAAY